MLGREAREDKEPRTGTVAGLHNRCPKLGIQTTRPPPYSHSPLLLSLPPPSPTMPEQTASQPASKSKHSHATSQAQPAPRKVRFNVGKGNHLRRASLPHPALLPRFAVPGARCRRRGCLRDRMLCRAQSQRTQGRHQENRPV